MSRSGIISSLNKIRELSSDLYQKQVPIFTEDMDLSTYGNAILEFPAVQNEFLNALINKLAYTQLETKMFRNPLQVLEGDALPLGYGGESIYVDRAHGRKFNVDDFAGLLAKYESRVKVQYDTINMDVQYPVTVSRQQLKKAFTSIRALEELISGITTSLYNGLYIDNFIRTKALISGAYKSHSAPVQVVSAISTEQTAKDFIAKARELYLNFQLPSSNYNAWGLVGDGEKITTWTNPEDIVFIVRNDIRAYMDVNVLASAFNVDKATLMGNIISVDNFDMYSEEGVKIFDGSKMVGLIADKAWFKIKTQDEFMDEFRNPNNRTVQYYLNAIKMFRRSLFANGVIFATEGVDVPATEIEFGVETATIEAGDHEGFDLTVKPLNATTEIEYEVTSATTGATTDLVLTASDDGRHVDVRATADASGDYVVTATAGDLSDTITITVE